MSLMHRALRGFREQIRTQIMSIGTVALALFCLASAVLALENAGNLSARWSAPVRVTVYLADGASSADVETLRSVLAELPEVAETHYVSPAQARSTIVQGGGDQALAGAAVELFPATIELRLASTAMSAERVQSLAERVRRINMVTDVETYRGITDQMQGLMASGRWVVGLIALLVLLCAMAVVTNTIRLSLHARMREVEVLNLVGASPRYIRAPFLVEGAMLGSVGAVLAVATLGGLFIWMRTHFDGSLSSMMGMHPAFLSVAVVVGFVVGGGMLGATGSALALRRWLHA